METYDLRAGRDMKCPWCGKELEAATGYQGSEPARDDLSVCAYCQKYLVFQDEGPVHRKLTDEEFQALPERIQRQLETMSGFLSSFKPRDKVKYEGEDERKKCGTCGKATTRFMARVGEGFDCVDLCSKCDRGMLLKLMEDQGVSMGCGEGENG